MAFLIPIIGVKVAADVVVPVVVGGVASVIAAKVATNAVVRTVRVGADLVRAAANPPRRVPATGWVYTVLLNELLYNLLQESGCPTNTSCLEVY